MVFALVRIEGCSGCFNFLSFQNLFRLADDDAEEEEHVTSSSDTEGPKVNVDVTHLSSEAEWCVPAVPETQGKPLASKRSVVTAGDAGGMLAPLVVAPPAGAGEKCDVDKGQPQQDQPKPPASTETPASPKGNKALVDYRIYYSSVVSIHCNAGLQRTTLHTDQTTPDIATVLSVRHPSISQASQIYHVCI